MILNHSAVTLLSAGCKQRHDCWPVDAFHVVLEFGCGPDGNEPLVKWPEKLQRNLANFPLRHGRQSERFPLAPSPLLAVDDLIFVEVKYPPIPFLPGLWVLTPSAGHRFSSFRWSALKR